jgi:CRISPR-associated protein Cmx8
MAKASKKTNIKPFDETSQESIQASWTLAELPSAQHRAGLAGLAMLVDYARRLGLPPGTVLEVANIDEMGLSLNVNPSGLITLFDRVYAASLVEDERLKPFQKKAKDGSKITVPPVRQFKKTIEDAKGHSKMVDVYVYNRVEPHGGPLTELVPAGDSGLWLKLWRDWLWNTLRAIPKQRKPFEQRAGTDVLLEEESEGEADSPSTSNRPKEAAIAWEHLQGPGPVPQASTYFLGAMEANAENVAFQDLGRFQFLLHFWPFAAQIFVPQTMDRDGKVSSEPTGYAVCIPDITRLVSFLRVHAQVLRSRSPEPGGFRPRQALVDLPEAAALKADEWFHQQLAGRMAGLQAQVTQGFQVIQTLKSGNSVRILANRTVVPTQRSRDATAVLKELWHPGVRRRLLENALEPDRPWWWGFDRLCATLPRSQTLDATSFRHDARTLFTHYHPPSPKETDMTDPERQPRDLEPLVLHLVTTWITSRLEGKYGLTWANVKDTPREREYSEKKAKLASEAFLAARSRPGQAFSHWFTSTLCSVNQRLTEQEFIQLSRALEQHPDQIRSITLLALSARG